MILNFQHRNKETQEVYTPIMHLIRNSGIESMKKIFKKSEKHDDEKTETSKAKNKSLNAGFSVKYCGSIYIGPEGDVKQIERAILQVLKLEEVKLIPVKFECLEIGIRITEVREDTVCNHNSLQVTFNNS